MKLSHSSELGTGRHLGHTTRYMTLAVSSQSSSRTASRLLTQMLPAHVSLPPYNNEGTELSVVAYFHLGGMHPLDAKTRSLASWSEAMAGVRVERRDAIMVIPLRRGQNTRFTESNFDDKLGVVLANAVVQDNRKRTDFVAHGLGKAAPTTGLVRKLVKCSFWWVGDYSTQSSLPCFCFVCG